MNNNFSYTIEAINKVLQQLNLLAKGFQKDHVRGKNRNFYFRGSMLRNVPSHKN